MKKISMYFVLLFFATALFARISPVLIHGENLGPKEIVLTIDDAPDRPGPDGTYQTVKIGQYLEWRQIKAIFFIVTCHFQGQPLPDPRSWICQEAPGEQPISLLPDLIDMGHYLGNHTADHTPLTFLSEEDMIYQVRQGQQVIQRFERLDDPHFFRPPGFWYDRWVYRSLVNLTKEYEWFDDSIYQLKRRIALGQLAYNDRIRNAIHIDPYLQSLVGPIGQDAGGQGFIGDSWINGDWDCYRQGYSVPACGQLYLDAIAANSAEGYGSVVLAHARTEYMSGADGSRDFPSQLTEWLVENLLAAGYTFSDPRKLIQAQRPELAPEGEKFVEPRNVLTIDL